MTDMEVKRAVESAAASNEIEGFFVDDDLKTYCLKAAQGKISREEYINYLIYKASAAN